MKNYTCYHISKNPDIYDTIKKSLAPEEVNFFDGSGYQSFSKLVNKCTEHCPTEIVIMMSDKTRPTHLDVKKVLQLISQGYAFVALYRFAFFGYKKELFRQIGCMDERFVGGGWEDNDFYIRLKEANLAAYITEEITYLPGSSSWEQPPNNEKFYQKWRSIENNTFPSVERADKNLHDEYDLGNNVETNFNQWKDSYIPMNKKLNKKVLRWTDLIR